MYFKDDIDRHRQYGLHSNIPACCVEFFCSQVQAGVEQIAKVQWEAFGLNWHSKYFELFRAHPAYVLCPLCMEELIAGRRDFPPIHKCNELDPECSKFIWLKS